MTKNDHHHPLAQLGCLFALLFIVPRSALGLWLHPPPADWIQCGPIASSLLFEEWDSDTDEGGVGVMHLGCCTSDAKLYQTPSAAFDKAIGITP